MTSSLARTAETGYLAVRLQHVEEEEEEEEE